MLSQLDVLYEVVENIESFLYEKKKNLFYMKNIDQRVKHQYKAYIEKHNQILLGILK